MVKIKDVIQRVIGNEDRLTTSREYYIGGEHYETDNIEIPNKGRIIDEDLGFKFHFPFEPGDVLFMARNPHLRKAGRVNFRGICSDASYILRTKDADTLTQDFIPIIMQSNNFWSFFATNKTGSVNPLLNWSTLEEYEFTLPSIDDQKKISTIIWAIQDDINLLKQELSLLNLLIKSRFIEMFKDYFDDKKCNPLESLCELFVDGDWIESKDQDESGIRLIQTGNVGIGQYLDKADRARFINEETFARLNCTEVLPGDVLVSRLPDPIARSCIVPEGMGKSITGVDCTIIRFKSSISPVFFNQYTSVEKYLSQVNTFEAGSTRKRISRKNLGKILVPVPPIELQEEFETFVQQVDKSKFELDQHIVNTKKLQKSLINKIFEQDA